MQNSFRDTESPSKVLLDCYISVRANQSVETLLQDAFQIWCHYPGESAVFRGVFILLVQLVSIVPLRQWVVHQLAVLIQKIAT